MIVFVRFPAVLQGESMRFPVKSRIKVRYYGDSFFTSRKLSRPPKGYPADWPDIDLLKYRDYCSMHTMPKEIIGTDQFFDHIVKVWKATVPLNLFIERALNLA